MDRAGAGERARGAGAARRELYGAAWPRDRRARAGSTPTLRAQLAADELVASLLVRCTACIPTTSQARVGGALDAVRPLPRRRTAATSSCSASTTGGRAAPPARQLRRLPVVVGHVKLRRRAGDRGRRAGGRPHRGRGIAPDATPARSSGGRSARSAAGPPSSCRPATGARPGARRRGRRRDAARAPSSPLAVLQRIRRPSPVPRRANAASCARAEIAGEHAPRRRPRRPRPALRLPALLPPVQLRGRRRRPLSRRPRPRTCTVADFALAPGPVGRPADPGRAGVLLPQLRARPGGRASTRARPAPPSRCCPSRPGTRWSPANPRAGRRSSPTSRRCWSAPARRALDCYLVPDRRLLRAGRPLRRLLAGLRRRPEAHAGARGVLRRRRARGPRRCPQGAVG